MANTTILLMDDDENICKVIRLYLEKEGMNVQVAHDGAAGLDLFHQETPDLVLLDIMMPGMDGIEVIKQIRRESSVPVIMLTAKGDTIDKVLALELGADDYIVKPFEPKELIARIKAVIRRTETAAEEPADFHFGIYRGILRQKAGAPAQGAGASLLPRVASEQGVHARTAPAEGVGIRLLRRFPHD